MHAEQVKYSLFLPYLSVTFKDENSPFMAEHFWKLFVELTLHFAKITSAYRANCTLNYAFLKDGTEMLNREGNRKQMSQHWWIHTYGWIADSDNQERKKTKNTSSSSLSLSCACFTSSSPSSPFTSSLAHWPLTFYWPSSLPCPILPASGTFSPPPSLLHGRKCVQIRVRHRKQLG